MLIFTFSCTKKNAKIKELPPIDFKTVDAYPLLTECELITNRSLQRACFYREITKKIQASLSDFKMNGAVDKDTIYAKIFIDNKGNSFYKNTNILNSILDSILTKSIQNLPKMSPAIKKGIPVNVEFTLPIIIN